ncbi:MAG: isoprenyl transferase [Eubacteriaceae bacterium]|nr:isoprenyl transferase [Eubacteriaceae bacterium]
MEPNPQNPSNIGIIMDGNGRWAQSRNLPRAAGHKRGAENVREAITCASLANAKSLSLFAFSTENWKRPASEVDYIMSLVVEYLAKEIDELKEKNVVIKFIGDISALPIKCRSSIADSEEKTKGNSGLAVNIALNYGARAEITRAAKQLAQDALASKITIGSIGEESISARLYDSSVPDLDLVIRTGAEKRLSNFMLWQAAYAEIYFTDILWPDFGRNEFRDAILFYQGRQRRYGGIDEG